MWPERPTHTEEGGSREGRDRQTDRTWFLTSQVLSTVSMKPNFISLRHTYCISFYPFRFCVCFWKQRTFIRTSYFQAKK